MSITLKALAEAAGVSRGTVDRVLHQRGAVKKVVRERIERLAKELGYVPNMAGRALSAHRTPYKIGVMIPALGNVFFDEVIEGINAAAREFQELGAQVQILSISGYDVQEHVSTIRKLGQSGCRALCLATVNTQESRAAINELVESGLKIVLLNTDVEDSRRLCYVGSDYLKAGRTCAGMLSMLVNLPRLKVLTVAGSKLILGHNLRLQGFREELQRLQVPFEEVASRESSDSDVIAREVTYAELSAHPEINCIYVTGAGTAGVGAAIKQTGRSDIICVGFDDIAGNKALLREGVLKFVICQQPRSQGYHAVKCAFMALAGRLGENPRDYITETIIKIDSNLD
ncbi:MAG: LacI family DNA-binding transcriptional regulator [Succinivibrio sp.]|nr:LacI family DNA-binding transcriptional regulator [Succinivibrio sp.]